MLEESQKDHERSTGELGLVPRPFWEGETAWQLLQVQTVTSAARELEDPIRFQIAVT